MFLAPFIQYLRMGESQFFGTIVTTFLFSLLWLSATNAASDNCPFNQDCADLDGFDRHHASCPQFYTHEFSGDITQHDDSWLDLYVTVLIDRAYLPSRKSEVGNDLRLALRVLAVGYLLG